MYGMNFLYELSNREIDVPKEKDLLMKIALFGNIETKSLILYKIKKNINTENYPVILDILNLIIDNTDYSNDTESIYKYTSQILQKIMDLITPNTPEYYKTIILSIKLIKITKSKSFYNPIVNKIMAKMEESDKSIFIRHILSKIQSTSISSIPIETANTILSNILQESENNESLLEDYKIFLHNLQYMPYLTNISIENIIKITKLLDNFKKKIKSLKIRNLLIDIIYNYFNKKDINYLIENFDKLQDDLFAKHLLTNRIVREINENPQLIHNQKIAKTLIKLSFDENSLIRSEILSNDILPLYLRVNSFKMRKYNVEALEKYMK
ncbi:MAG: hypothetical protein N2169_05270 [bacterium]|nr:hypothetical protein [bacterium]